MFVGNNNISGLWGCKIGNNFGIVLINIKQTLVHTMYVHTWVCKFVDKGYLISHDHWSLTHNAVTIIDILFDYN